MLERKISITTIITFSSYMAYMCYRFGESIFYGYPITLIWTDLNNLVSTLLQNSIILLAYFGMLWVAIKRKETILYNLLMILFAISGAIAVNYDYFIEDYQGVLLCVAIFIFVFTLSSLIQTVMEYEAVGRSVNLTCGVLLVAFCGLATLTGNYFASIKTLMVDSQNLIIVADYKDKVVKIKCNRNGDRQIIVSSLDDNNLKSVPNNFFKRDWLVGKCVKEKESVNVDPLFV